MRIYTQKNCCETCIWSVCNYNKIPWGEEDEPKDEPQTMRDENYVYAYDKEQCEWSPIRKVEDDPQTDEEQFCIEHKCTYYRPKEGGCTKNNGDCPFDEPQTDSAWGKGE